MGRVFDKALSGIIVLISPIVLIHGYSEDSSVWDSWMDWFTEDNITNVIPIGFHNDDQCGSVADHALELKGLVDMILSNEGAEKVNIVAHSKGGLDARAYISQNPGKVENLIMIATPNSGTEAARMDLTDCAYHGSAGLADLLPNSEATQVLDHWNTTYYAAIAGNYPMPCFFVLTPICYVVENDGFVTVDSARGITYPLLGVFPYNHTGLLEHKDVYQKVLPIIS